MKRIITIAIAFAVAVPAVVTAAEMQYDYNTVTTLLFQLETHIEDGDIAFDTQSHKETFLSGIDQVYDYRDADNFSACVTTCDNLATYASQWIEDDVAHNASEVCASVADIYEEDSDTFDWCSISEEDEDEVDDGLEDLCGSTIVITITIVHESCDWGLDIDVDAYIDL